MSAIESVLAALYLRGFPRSLEPHARSWPGVLSFLRKAAIADPFQASELLRDAGFSNEAACLNGKAIDYARRLVESDLTLTVASPHYPRAWIERLGASAPPALYARGAVDLLARPALAVVGSRNPPAKSQRAAAALAQVAGELGFVVVSGGAPGIDRAAGSAAAFLEVWPCGLAMRWGARNPESVPCAHLSLWPSREAFSTAGAMERNTLVYALAEAAFVGHARFKQGGSWHGATDALRRRLTRVLVSATPWPRVDIAAQRALIGLGAGELAEPSAAGLRAALEAAPLQPWLPSMRAVSTADGSLSAY